MTQYVHGYSEKESSRLFDQANTLTELLHHDTHYPPGSVVLEAGCGIGAQTVILALKSLQSQFTAIDKSQVSIDEAQSTIHARSIKNVVFKRADIFDLPFGEEYFDHIFVCFLLEHLQRPREALGCLKKVLKRGGTMTVIEGDHGSFYCHPESREAMLTVQCLIDIQASHNGNARIGRQVYPLLCKAGYQTVRVSPRMVYVDSSKPDLVEGFSKNTFIAMVEGVEKQALNQGLIDEQTWAKGIKDLYRATEEDGTFCYTFFKGTAVKP